MKICEMNWLQVEEYLKTDDRAVVPLGCTEQHAYLSLSVDSILAERVALEAAAPTGVPVFPVQAYGITPYFMAYPGTVSLKADTYLRIITDILDSLKRTGFRRILFVNGHGGNTPGQTAAIEWMGQNPDCRVRFHNWWNAPRTFEKVKEIDPVASHASWMENFPWTRLPGIEQPTHQKPMVDLERMRTFDPEGVREILQEGNFGGYFQRSDDEMNAIWSVAIDETRALIEKW
ncbi:creatinine amidohydrolase [Microvirga flocculans]|uniref:Creatinine amidohydrolase n=1 Tax=Microvirga flocculans TaxID=217168 RepID=A0A7W6IHS6_9HYPH|nr:creatininase family protein [Microvirga flocculans]MBB4041750.1 creatinine amidohydrolase [Microvirga flocculans]